MVIYTFKFESQESFDECEKQIYNRYGSGSSTGYSPNYGSLTIDIWDVCEVEEQIVQICEEFGEMVYDLAG